VTWVLDPIATSIAH